MTVSLAAGFLLFGLLLLCFAHRLRGLRPGRAGWQGVLLADDEELVPREWTSSGRNNREIFMVAASNDPAPLIHPSHPAPAPHHPLLLME